MSKNRTRVDSAALNRRQLLSAAAGTALTVGSSSVLAQSSSTVCMSAKDPDVLDAVIIGGGLAGLTAARDLSLAGSDNFVLLEARDRVGGRTFNHDLKHGGFSEAGGQWISYNQTAVWDLVRQLNLGSFSTPIKGKIVYLSGDSGRFEEENSGAFSGSPETKKVIHELNELAKSVPSGAAWTAPRAAELDAISLYDWLKTKNLNDVDMWSQVVGAYLSNVVHAQKISLLYFLSMINSADSSYEQLEGFGVGSAQETRIEGGSQRISQVMAEQLGDKVKMSIPVRKISDWNGDVVTIHTDHGVFRTRKVIMAMQPVMCNAIDYQPALPAARKQLQQTWPAHGPARKTATVYPKPFWREKGYCGWVIQADGPVFWAYDNSPEDDSVGIINAFVNHAMISDDDDTASKQLAEIYARALGEEALTPIEFAQTDWGQEEFTRSCVSPLPPGYLTSGIMPALRESVGNIIWSGTETAEIWHGYMDGAVRSGHSAALIVLNSLNNA